jgi:hypothetical protein
VPMRVIQAHQATGRRAGDAFRGIQGISTKAFSRCRRPREVLGSDLDAPSYNEVFGMAQRETPWKPATKRRSKRPQ